MKVIERKFRLLGKFGSDAWCFSSAGIYRWRTDICYKRLCEYFEIPDSVRVIWMSLHTHPAANRLAVRVIQKYPGAHVVIVVVGGSPIWDVVRCYGNRLSELTEERTLYTQVEYLE